MCLLLLFSPIQLLACPPLSPRVCSDSCPLSWWYFLTISSFAAPFSFYLQSFPASKFFPMNQLFASDSWSIGASASVLPMNRHGWFPLGPTGLISLQSKGLSRSPFTTQFESINSSVLGLLYSTTLTFIHDYWKKQSLTIGTFVGKVISLPFNTLCRFVIAFLPRSKHLLISWLESPSTLI